MTFIYKQILSFWQSNSFGFASPERFRVDALRAARLQGLLPTGDRRA